ncbi:hypothetical protein [Ruminococcus sp.]|uniref:hypothetical protein n=1 Tax=Ruminococcus sp. TaxID=41978 RepID=UPI00386E3EB7
MKHHRLLHHLISILLALSILAAVGCMSALAAPGDGNQNNSQPDQPQSQVETPQTGQGQQTQQGQQAQQGQQSQQEAQAQPQQEAPQEQAPQQDQPRQEPNQWYDPIYSYEEDTPSPYVEPEHLAELPAVSPSQVQEATSVAIPVVAVSDASLFSGIVMWLCVALGIAVIVGVLVSRRTRRRG